MDDKISLGHIIKKLKRIEKNVYAEKSINNNNENFKIDINNLKEWNKDKFLKKEN